MNSERNSSELRYDHAKMILDFIAATRRSTYTTVAGRPSTFFTDLDEYCLGHTSGGIFDPIVAQSRRRWLDGELVTRLLKLAAQHTVSRLVFLEKRDGGPVGGLTLMNLVLLRTSLDACIVRPRKRLLASSIKGRPLQRGERVLIVSDVATTGSTILAAARRVRELGGNPVAAFVIQDRGEGATEALRQQKLDLHALINPQIAREASVEMGMPT